MERKGKKCRLKQVIIIMDYIIIKRKNIIQCIKHLVINITYNKIWIIMIRFNKENPLNTIWIILKKELFNKIQVPYQNPVHQNLINIKINKMKIILYTISVKVIIFYNQI